MQIIEAMEELVSKSSPNAFYFKFAGSAATNFTSQKSFAVYRKGPLWFALLWSLLEMLSAQNSENVMSERFGLKQQVKYPNVDDTLKPVANIQTS
jgi:hypothetical protein